MKKYSRNLGFNWYAGGFVVRAKKFKGSSLEKLIEFEPVRSFGSSCGWATGSNIAGEKLIMGKLLSFVC